MYHPIDVTDSSDLRNWERVTPTAIPARSVRETGREKLRVFFVVTGSVCCSDGSQVTGDSDKGCQDQLIRSNKKMAVGVGKR